MVGCPKCGSHEVTPLVDGQVIYRHEKRELVVILRKFNISEKATKALIPSIVNRVEKPFIKLTDKV